HLDQVGNLDILCPIMTDITPGPPDADRRDLFGAWAQARPNRRLCWYFACWPCTNCIGGPGPPGPWPNYIIDAAAGANRGFAWHSFNFVLPTEFYFAMAVNYRKELPWQDVYYFGNNGDGTLVYPGTPARIGGQHDIPIASIRLKLIREGREDFEYLKLLADKG